MDTRGGAVEHPALELLTLAAGHRFGPAGGQAQVRRLRAQFPVLTPNGSAHLPHHCCTVDLVLVDGPIGEVGHLSAELAAARQTGRRKAERRSWPAEEVVTCPNGVGAGGGADHHVSAGAGCPIDNSVGEALPAPRGSDDLVLQLRAQPAPRAAQLGYQLLHRRRCWLRLPPEVPLVAEVVVVTNDVGLGRGRLDDERDAVLYPEKGLGVPGVASRAGRIRTVELDDDVSRAQR